MLKNLKKQQIPTRKNYFKPFWAILLVVAILCIVPISAEEFTTLDNIKQYDEETQTVTIVNTLGLGRDIATIQLNTPLNLEVGAGYQKVAEFTIDSFDDTYSDAFKKMEFYDLNNNEEKFERDFDYKYKTTELVEVNDYKEVCELSLNGTKVCESVLSGTHKEEKEVWKDLDTSVLTKGKVTIGIFTYVEVGDYVEWIPTLFGKEIDEWATWTTNLNVGLRAYYSFDHSSGTNAINNVTGATNGTLSATSPVWVEGKLGNALDFVDGDGKYINLTGLTSSTTSHTFCFWIKNRGISTNDNFIFDIQAGRIGCDLDLSQQLVVFGTFTYDVLPNAWTDVCIVLDSSAGNIRVYYNGAQVGSNESYVDKNIGGNIAIGNYNTAGAGYYANWTIDEFGIWNRTLTDAEVTQLYNGGSGITYGVVDDSFPTVTLNTPINTSNFTTNNINFGGVVSDDINLINVSRILNDVYIETNTSGINNSNYTFSATLTDGDYTWTYETCDNSSQCTNGTARSFNINTTPYIQFENPTPVNEYNSSVNSFVVNTSITETYFNNITFDLYNFGGGINRTVTFTNTSREKDWTNLINGVYSYNVTVWTTTDQSNSTETRNITIDTTNPAVEILAPSETISSHVLNENIFFNWSANDTHLDTCIYEYEGVNTTVTCSDNTTNINITNTINRTITFYVNDTFGNINVTSITWAYNFLETGDSFTVNVFETKNYTFEINVTSYQTLTSFSAFLSYNGTTYSADSSCDGGDCEISAHIDIPLITDGSSSENKTFFWRLSIFNGTGTSNINTSTQTQVVTAVNFVECNVAPNYANISSVNFTILKETGRTALNANFNAYFKYYLGTGTEYKEGNSSQTGANIYNFCIDQNETFYTSSNIDLSASTYDDRHYDLVKEIYTNTTTIQPLYLLNSTLASIIIIEVKDQGLVPLENIIVNISRFYPGEGRYYQVENQITDEYGQIVAKLIENDAKYRFTFYSLSKNLLKTSELISIACRTVICFLPFVIEDTTDDFERFENLTTYTSTLSFDNTTNVFAFSWDDQRGESTITRLEVTRYQLNASSLVCNTSSTSILSTLTCSVGGQRASYKAQVFRIANGESKRINVLNIKVGDPALTYGVEGLLWVFILLMTCVGIGAYNPTIGAALYGGGFIIMGVVGLISMPIPVFFANTLLVILFIWGVNR